MGHLVDVTELMELVGEGLAHFAGLDGTETERGPFGQLHLDE